MERLMQGLTVTQVNAYIKELFDDNELLQDVWVQGEVSRLSRPASGHVYFTLKDAQSSLRCVMWRNVVGQLRALPAHGEEILARGNISVYTVQGEYQLYVSELHPVGLGLLNQEFERIKRKLSEEGLFAEARKRRPPTFPRSIGIVTSSTGAAYQDILRVLRERFPLVKVVLAHSPVQGDIAPQSIVAAIRNLLSCRQEHQIDLIILARGGGSLEDLWAFNDEQVARAIAASDVPIISGIGHEIDFTIADFVADHRAPTPTAAAMAAVPDQMQLRQQIDELEMASQGMVMERLRRWRERLERRVSDLARGAPRARLAADRRYLSQLLHQVYRLVQHRAELSRDRVAGLNARLQALDPQAVLGRGYAIVVQRMSGRVVSRVELAASGERLDVRVSDGTFGALVE